MNWIRPVFAGVGVLVAMIVTSIFMDDPKMGMMFVVGAVVVGTMPFQLKLSTAIALCTSGAAFILPGFPGNPMLWEAAAMGCWSGVTFSFLMREIDKVALKECPATARFIIFGCATYCATLLFLMRSQGIGFNILGSEMYGGRFYFAQFTCAIFPIAFLLVPMKGNTYVGLSRLGCVLSLTFIISDIAFFSGSRWGDLILMFLAPPGDAQNFLGVFERTGLLRIQSLGTVAVSATVLILTYINPRQLLSPKGLPFCILIGLLTGLSLVSGHRIALVNLVLLLGIMIIAYRALNVGSMMIAVAGLAMFLCYVYMFTDTMPLSAQRAVSFLPGIEVDPVALDSSEGTLDARRQLRNIGMGMIPRYFWEGRGFGFSSSGMDFSQLARYDVGAAVIQEHVALGRFYNGFIGLMVITGSPGTLSILIIVGAGTILAVSILKRVVTSTTDTALERTAALGATGFLSSVIIFFGIHGDAEYALKGFGLSTGILILANKMLNARDFAAQAVRDVAPSEEEHIEEAPRLPAPLRGRPYVPLRGIR